MPATDTARVARRGGLTSPSLIGRDAELAELCASLTAYPGLTTLHGEAGVGKTRLLAEALARPQLASFRRLTGRCHQVREPFPLGAVIEALRGLQGVRLRLGPLSGALRPLLPELEDTLAASPEPTGDVGSDRHRVFRALVEVIGALGPTILSLEDLHWADPLTLEFLPLLLDDFPDNLSLVLTYRPEDLEPPGWLTRTGPAVTRTTLDLQPLDPPRVTELVRAILESEDVSDEFGTFIFESTSGVPFAIEEMLRLMQDRRDLVSLDGRWVRHSFDQIGVPSAIRDTVLERVGRLSGDARDLLAAASVLAGDADAELLAAVANLPAERMLPALSEAVSSGILSEIHGSFTFRHVLARQAVYEATPSPTRRDLHRRAATTLEGSRPDRPGALARHFREAGLSRKWTHYAEAAADAAAALGNHAVAARFLAEIIVARVVEPADRCRLGHKLAEAAVHGLAHEVTIPVLLGLQDDQDIDPGERAELRLDLARLLNQSGQVRASFVEYEKAAADLPHRPDLAARALSSLGSPWVADFTVEDHLRWAERAIRLAEQSNDPDVLTFVEVDRARTLLHVGDPRGWEAAEALKEVAGSVEQERQLNRGFLNMAFGAIFLGHDDRALSFLHEGERHAERAASSRLEDSARACHSLLDWEQGRWAGLDAVTSELIRKSQGWPAANVDAKLVHALIVLARGDVSEAERLLEETYLAATDSGGLPLAATAAAALARIDLARDRSSDAAERIAALLETVRRKGIWVWATDLLPAASQAFVALGRRDEARELERQVDVGTADRDAPAVLAALEVARGWISSTSRPAAARERFTSGARLWEVMDRPYRAAQAHEAAGAAGVGSRDAIRSLQEALETYAALGATWDADRARRSLRRLGVKVGRRTGRKPYGRELSPREREVAAFAAQGRTNAEIAGELFLSVKTVEKHIAAALRKLEIDSRRALNLRLLDPSAEKK